MLVQIIRHTKHEMPKQDNLDLCNSQSESALENFKNLPSPPTSTLLIKRPKNAHNLENTNNYNIFKALENKVN